MSTTAPKKPAPAAPAKAASTAPDAAKSAPKPGPAAKAPPVSPVTGAAPAPTPAAEASVVASAQSVILGTQLRKKELIDDVVARSGIKKKDAKPVIEAMLTALGDALTENRELVLPPFGKLKVRRARDMPNARVLTAKIRQPKNV